MFGAIGSGRLFRWRLGARAFMLGACVVALVCGSALAVAEPESPFDEFDEPVVAYTPRKPVAVGPLRIASWNLSDAVRAGGLHREKRKKAVWRNTFVPRQRAVRNDSHSDKRLDGVDIVLLQGVHSIREARRLFPARGWKLVVSRAILKGSRGRGPFARVMPEGFETTAIAVRYKLGVRVTGQEHLLALAETDGAPGASLEAPGGGAGVAKKWDVSELKPNGQSVSARAEDGDGNGDTATVVTEDFGAQAGLAVRVFYNQRVIWLVSAALSSRCARAPSCEGRAQLHDWIEDKRDFEFDVIVGGRVPRGVFKRAHERDGTRDGRAQDAAGVGGGARPRAADTDAGGAQSCDGQALQSVPPPATEVAYLPGAGCIAVLELAK